MDLDSTYELPAEDDLALVYLEAKYRAELNGLIDGCDNGNAIHEFQFAFMNRVLAAARALDIDYFKDFQAH